MVLWKNKPLERVGPSIANLGPATSYEIESRETIPVYAFFSSSFRCLADCLGLSSFLSLGLGVTLISFNIRMVGMGSVEVQPHCLRAKG